jgi:tetratricopeptide (TPR) repeat protein
MIKTKNSRKDGIKQAMRYRLIVSSLVCLLNSIPILGNGLPGEYLINQIWRDAYSSHSLMTNTAFQSYIQYLSVYLTHAMTVSADYQTSEATVLLPLGKIHTLGVSYTGSGASIDEGTAFDGNGNVVYTGKASDRNNVGIIGYAINPVKGLSIGVNAQYIYNNTFGTKLNGYGGDFSLSYKFPEHETLGRHILGVSTHNLIIQGEADYSSAVTLSWYATFLKNVLESQFDFSTRDIMAKKSEFDAESEKSIDMDFSYKIGIRLFKAVKISGHVGMKYFGFSGGVQIPTSDDVRDISLLYQMVMPYGGAYPAHSFMAGAEFGQPRKETVEKGLKRKASLIPSDLYNKAMQLYSEGKYWDAYWVFSRILVEYPDFIKNDWVSMYSGRCLEMLDIRVASYNQYQRTTIKYSKSKSVHYANSGMMNIFYRDDDFQNVEKMHGELIKAGVHDSLRNHAHYLMGETYIKTKEYDKALDILGKVQENHIDYLFARHSMAVAEILKENYDKALVYLKECLSKNSKTPQEEEMVYRTFLFTGYIFYEEKEYPNALASLSMIPKKSLYYEDALLGMGWISLRGQQYDDCLGYSRDLQNLTRWVVNFGEGALLEGYVNLMRKSYDAAVQILGSASARLAGAKVPSQDELAQNMEGYQQIRSNYESLGKSVETYGMEKQNVEVLEKIDSLNLDQKEMKVKIDEHYKYVDDFNRESFFARNLEIVREDIDYAYARASKMAALKNTIIEQEKAGKKTQDIDNEIEKLKGQMQKNGK